MRILSLIFLMLFAFSLAHGKEYGSYDVKRMLIVSESPTGKKHAFDIKYLDQMLADLALHAKNYPPQFDTPQDRERAIKDIKLLSGMLEILVNDKNPNIELLWRAGFVNSMGYNLNIFGSGDKATKIFEKVLTIAPSHRRGNYLYGLFLAGANKPKEALPYLQTSASLGFTDAFYTLGLTYLALGDREKALVNLEAYQKKKPNDKIAAKFIDVIQNKNTKIISSQQSTISK